MHKAKFTADSVIWLKKVKYHSRRGNNNLTNYHHLTNENPEINWAVVYIIQRLFPSVGPSNIFCPLNDFI